MIGTLFLIGLGVFGIGVSTVAIGMLTDKDTIIKTGVIMLLTPICIVALSLILAAFTYR